MAINWIWRCLNTIYLWDGSAIQSEMVLGLNCVGEVWFVPSCYPGSAGSALLHGVDGLERHPCGNQLHQKERKHFMYIYDKSVIKYGLLPGLNHVEVVCFVPSSSPGSASSIHLHSFDGLGIHQLTIHIIRKCPDVFIWIWWKCNIVWSGTWPQTCQSGIFCTQLLPSKCSHIIDTPSWLWIVATDMNKLTSETMRYSALKENLTIIMKGLSWEWR